MKASLRKAPVLNLKRRLNLIELLTRILDILCTSEKITLYHRLVVMRWSSDNSSPFNSHPIQAPFKVC